MSKTAKSHAIFSESGAIAILRGALAEAAGLFQRQYEPAARTHRDLIRCNALLERKGFTLEPEEVDAIGDEGTLLRHAERLEVYLHLARLLPVGVDAGDVPGLARATRDDGVLTRE